MFLFSSLLFDFIIFFFDENHKKKKKINAEFIIALVQIISNKKIKKPLVA